MKQQIHTTYTGSLPRPQPLKDLLYALEQGEAVDQSIFEAQVRSSVSTVVGQQASCGLDIVNDGEMGKISYATYVKDRLSGFGGESRPPTFRVAEFPQFIDFYTGPQAPDFGAIRFPTCIAPIVYVGQELLARDISNLLEALRQAGRSPADAFMTAASPGTVASWLNIGAPPDAFYNTYEEYLSAIAAAMKAEYDAIVAAGLTLQLDCPDLQSPTVYQTVISGGREVDESELRSWHVEALNEAARDIPPERLRMHVCWGNYEAPHTGDTPLRAFIGDVLRARPATLVLEAANPRHEHEWQIFEEVKLPEDKRLVLGVLGTTTRRIEHPELVAQRIVRVAKLVGPERVLGGDGLRICILRWDARRASFFHRLGKAVCPGGRGASRIRPALWLTRRRQHVYQLSPESAPDPRLERRIPARRPSAT